jgi:hypothetical protein
VEVQIRKTGELLKLAPESVASQITKLVVAAGGK